MAEPGWRRRETGAPPVEISDKPVLSAGRLDALCATLNTVETSRGTVPQPNLTLLPEPSHRLETTHGEPSD